MRWRNDLLSLGALTLCLAGCFTEKLRVGEQSVAGESSVGGSNASSAQDEGGTGALDATGGVAGDAAGARVTPSGGNAGGPVGTSDDAGDSAGEGLLPSPIASPLRVAVGKAHICVTRGGRVWCWAFDAQGNEFGQAGSTPSHEITVPTQIAGISQAIDIGASDRHTCALLGDGQVTCWGANDSGQIGPESAADACYSELNAYPCQPTPTVLSDIKSAVELELGDYLTCVRVTDGSISCRGIRKSLEPLTDLLATVSDASSLSLGHDSGCVVHSGGTLECSEQPSGFDPSTVARVELSDGGDSACVLREGGRVDCWGNNARGQLGIGRAGSGIPAGQDVSAIESGAIDLALGSAHACALVAAGEVFCWGYNEGGVIGVPEDESDVCDDVSCQLTPRSVEGLPEADPVVRIAAGGQATCAVTQDSLLFCWGTAVEGGERGAVQVPGPWDEASATCDELSASIDEQAVRAFEVVDKACQTDSDCVRAEGNIACHSACMMDPVSQTGRKTLRAQLATLEAETCREFEALDCQVAPASCPTTPEPLCAEGRCQTP